MTSYLTGAFVALVCCLAISSQAGSAFGDTRRVHRWSAVVGTAFWLVLLGLHSMA